MTRMTNRTSLKLAATGMLMAGASMLGSSPAHAAEPTRPTPSTVKVPAALDQIKKEGAAAIDDREAQLAKLAGRLSQAPNCDSSGKIAGVISADQPALRELGAKLAADTNVPAAVKHFKSIFEDYRVYLVVTPQAYVTAACGHIQKAVTSLNDLHSKLDERVRQAEAGGADMSAAKAALSDMATKLSDASSRASSANSALEAIGPDHGDLAVAQSNWEAVSKARTDLTSAYGALKTAARDARTVLDALKSGARH